VSLSDHGSWTCVLTLDKDFEQQKTFVDLEVAVKPILSLIEAVEKTTNQGDLTVINVKEGQLKTVRCVAETVFPRPEFSWTLSRGSPDNIIALDSHPMVTISPSSYLVTSSYTVMLNITSININQSILTCHTTQYDITGTILYITNVSTIIKVHPHSPLPPHPFILPSSPQTSHSTELLPLLLLSVLVTCTGRTSVPR
jgi:hypothetical protein